MEGRDNMTKQTGRDSRDTHAMDWIEMGRPCLDRDTTDAELARWAREFVIPALEDTGRL